MWYSLLGVCIIFCNPMAGQQDARSALLDQLRNASNDTIRFNIQREIGFGYEDEDTTKALEYYRMNLALATRLNDCEMLSKTHTDFGNVHMSASDNAVADHHYRKALLYAFQCGDQRRAGRIYSNLGMTFENRNKLDSAIFYNLEAVKLMEGVNDLAGATVCYNHLAHYYSKLQFNDQAVYFANRAVAIGKSISNQMAVTTGYINMAKAYREMGDSAACILRCDSAAGFVSLLPTYYNRAASFQNLARIYFTYRIIGRASQFADSSIYYADKMNNPRVALAAYSIKGGILAEQGKHEMARILLTKAEAMALEEKNWSQLFDVYGNLAHLEFTAGNYIQAYRYMGLHDVYRDSTMSADVNSRIAEMSARYEAELQQQEIKRLAAQNEHETERTRQQRRLTLLFIGLSALAVVIAVLINLNYKRRMIINRKNEDLQLQRIRELENQRQMVAMDAIIKGEENERSRMAKDLHDGLGSLLSGVKLSLSSMKGNVIISEEYAGVFNSSLQQLDNAISEMRRVAHNMMPESLLKYGLIQATQNLCDTLNESGALNVHFEQHNFSQRLASDQEITLFRMMQELLNNSIKHADAKNIIIQFSRHENNIHLVVEDDGKGFDTTAIKDSEGVGYMNIRNRVNYLKGSMDVKSDPGKGTSVLIEFPA